MPTGWSSTSASRCNDDGASRACHCDGVVQSTSAIVEPNACGSAAVASIRSDRQSSQSAGDSRRNESSDTPRRQVGIEPAHRRRPAPRSAPRSPQAADRRPVRDLAAEHHVERLVERHHAGRSDRPLRVRGGSGRPAARRADRAPGTAGSPRWTQPGVGCRSISSCQSVGDQIRLLGQLAGRGPARSGSPATSISPAGSSHRNVADRVPVLVDEHDPVVVVQRDHADRADMDHEVALGDGRRPASRRRR